MKKLLLFSAIALASATAGAQSVNEYFNVVYHGQPVENGGNIVSKEFDTEAGWYHADIEFIPKNDYQNAAFHVLGVYTGIPTSTQWQENKAAWGTPSICWASGSNGSCIPTITDRETEFENFTVSNSQGIVAGQLVVQFHIISDEYEDFGPDFNPMDPSTYPPAKPTPETCHYKITVTPTVEGKVLNPFTVNVFMGPEADEMAGVDGVVVDNDAPVVYFDLAGRRVLNPAKGQIVIERQGSKARKVVM